MSKGRNADKCISPGCRSPRKTRGLCRTCYGSLYAQITADGSEYTWEMAEAAGVCLTPHDKRNSKNPAVRALANLVPITPVSSESPQPQ